MFIYTNIVVGVKALIYILKICLYVLIGKEMDYYRGCSLYAHNEQKTQNLRKVRFKVFAALVWKFLWFFLAPRPSQKLCQHNGRF